MTSTVNFQILGKEKTSRGANFYKLLIELANGIWEEAVYFGNTKPKKITSIRSYGDGWVVEIQRHTSRDAKTGRFKSARKIVK